MGFYCCHFNFQKGTNCNDVDVLFSFFSELLLRVDSGLLTSKFSVTENPILLSLRASETTIHCVGETKCDQRCRLATIYFRTSRYYQVRHSHVRVQHGHGSEETAKLQRSLDRRPWCFQAAGQEQKGSQESASTRKRN